MDEALHSSMEDDDGNLMESHRIFRSLDDFASGPSSCRGSYSTEDNIRPSLVPSKPRNRRPINSHMPLAKAKSTPLHLNQIFEERESDLDDSPRSSPRIERSRKHTGGGGGGGAIKPRRNPRRLSPVTSSGSRRSSSCSSSDDDDLDKHMKRLNTSSSCRRSPRQYRRDDSGSEGDGGLDGSGSRHRMGQFAHTTSNQSSTNDNTSKGNTQQQNGGGKTNCMNSYNKFTTLDCIDESNKENMFGEQGTCARNTANNNHLLLNENTSVVNSLDECVMAQDSSDNPAHPDYTCLVPERKGSAVKYIHSFSELERTLVQNNGDHLLCNGGSAGKRDSLTPADLENIDMKVDAKRQKTLKSESSHLQVLRSPTVRSVTSACCQIF